MQRIHQATLIVSMLGISWLLMQAVHELGHCLAAWATGGTVAKVVLHPLAISRTDVEPNPRPLLVAWGGPIGGIVLPLIVWGAAAFARLRVTYILRFFAGFCLLANGLYLGIGSFNAIGDAGDIMRHGSPQWALWLFGLATAPAGLVLWNGLGSEFGIGASTAPVSGRLAFGSMAALIALVVLEWIFSDR